MLVVYCHELFMVIAKHTPPVSSLLTFHTLARPLVLI